MVDKNIMIDIILESRLSLEDAMNIFKVSNEKINELLNPYATNERLVRALKYLFYNESLNSELVNTQKSRFKATLLLKKYLNILKISDKVERNNKLKEFIDDLRDKDTLNLTLKPKNDYTTEDKLKIIKYQLKYALGVREIEEIFNIKHNSLLKCQRELTDINLKKNIDNLKEYNLTFFGKHSYKR